MQEHYTSEDHMSMVRMIRKLYCHQSEEELCQTIDHFFIDHKTFWSSTGPFQTSSIWKFFDIKDGKSYLWHNMYANPFTKVLGLVGCRMTSKNLGIGPSERNWKDYKHVQNGQSSSLQSESPEKKDIIYGAAKMHKNSIIVTRCAYNWTDMMVDMGLDNIVNNDRGPRHSRIFHSWIEDW